jgi:adenylosuccinate synthase
MKSEPGNWYVWSEIQERHEAFGASVVLWNQWGDEWKWKISDRLMQESDVVVRFNGGHNAGHTVKVWDKEFDLHILPSWMVTEGKENIITSGCVLGIDLRRVNFLDETFDFSRHSIVCTKTTEEIFKKEKKTNQDTRVWLIPELEKLQAWWIDISKSWLKISGETIVIGIHNVLLDAFDEACRMHIEWLQPIGSTWSGISRAYASETQRFHFTLNDLIHHEDTFYDSIRALWIAHNHIFPNIGVEALIAHAKLERTKILRLIDTWVIEVIRNEREYIKDLHRNGKKIVGEWAQSSMIGSDNSFFWTASDPSFETFSRVTWLTAKKIGNVFLVHKLPPSSVGTRPQYLKFPEWRPVNDFRAQYKEWWVSTSRPRDLFRHSLPETARWSMLNVRWIDDEWKIVPVYNRVDGLKDSLMLDNNMLRAVTWFSEKSMALTVWIHDDETKITPESLLTNYPEKSAQAQLFGLTEENLRLVEMPWEFDQKVEQLLWLYNASIFRKDANRTFLIGTWPDREDLELRNWTPLRSI